MESADKIAEDIMRDKRRNVFPLISGGLYLLSDVISVGYAWASGRHLYDFGISFSAYVGLQRWTSVMHFIFMCAVVAMMTVYLMKAKLTRLKKMIYTLIFVCIFGTAFFPFNTFSDAPTAVTVDMHNCFGLALMLMTTVSFVISAVTSKSRAHRITAVISLAYALAFILMYSFGAMVLFRLFFLWENLFITALFIEMFMERFDEEENK